ncbi:calmodulin-binding protein 60 D-like [Aristolochia californica]|uniref:calmodulin-binding protein 60 D-like n=1 Tax=Aristolochia californica TaxID=171875 RepID=UPI0035E1EB9F
MMREKRGLDSADLDDVQPEAKKPKVPALASVIVEALKVDSLQKLCSSLEPILRRVVSEEVERALAKLGPAKLSARSSPKRIEGPDGRNLQLHFRSRLSLPLFTGGKVEGEQGAAILVVLLDANTDCVVTTGPESSARLDVVVLEGDFNNEDDDDWTPEDFESHVVKEREGRRPLLTGDLLVSLKEGVGTLGDLTFTDNSSWIRSRKFRLGLKVAPGCCDNIRVREAKTDAFTVKDHRGELYKKHYPPALNDDVWRLEKIGKDGSFHKRLNKAGIYTVEDFLRFVVRDPQRLRSVLGSGMSNKMWESLVEHAKTCVLSGKHYVYYPDDTRNVGVVFNNIYELRGLIAGGQYCSAETLNDSQKVSVDTLVKKAYDNWMHVIEYDGRALLNLKQSKMHSTRRNDSSVGSSEYLSVDPQMSLPRLPVSIPSEPAAGDAGLTVGGNSVSPLFIENSGTRYQNPQHVQYEANTCTHVQYEANTFVPQNELITSSHQNQIVRNDSVGLALGPPQSSSFSFQSIAGTSGQISSNLNSYDDWSHQRDNRGVEDYFPEEEIRMRSHEMLENEDMQHLLRIFNMGGTAPANVPDDGYPFSTYAPAPSPSFSFDEDRSRSSGKAVVGWLKLKAALRWGIFIRKRAAERRAQLVELDD